MQLPAYETRKINKYEQILNRTKEEATHCNTRLINIFYDSICNCYMPRFRAKYLTEKSNDKIRIEVEKQHK